MIHFKEGVKFEGVQPVLWDGLLTVAVVYHTCGYPLVVTSLTDGQHMEGSLHYVGKAADLRTRHLKVNDVPVVVRALKVALGQGWDVVLEGDHIHIEFQPKPGAV